MSLDPQAQAVLESAARANLPAYADMTAPQARELYRETRGKLQPALPEVALVMDLYAGDVPARYYRASGTDLRQALPGLVWFHGGGWTIGDLDTHDVLCRELANYAHCAVVSVGYRLAPEHKFPAAVDDAVTATRWVAAQGEALGIDASRLAIGGDSAGGNLAAVAALALRDAGGPPLAMQMLIYPATDLAAEHPSHFKFAEGYLLTRANVQWFRANYLASAAQVDDWRASPLRAHDLSRLPAAYILTAGFDPLVDEGKAYADRLVAAGVTVTYECFEGMIHGFIVMGGAIAAANHALYRATTALKQAFAHQTEARHA